MPKKSAHESQREKALRLRIKGRKTTREIHRITGVSVSTLHYWLKDHPLTKQEISKAISASPRYKAPKKELGTPGQYAVQRNVPNPIDLGTMGESIVTFNLSQRGYCVAKSVGDGDVVDLYVRRRGSEKVAFLQVRVSSNPPSRSGLPTISLRRHRNGRAYRFDKGDFHFLVGFCRQDGRCYVYSSDEVSHLRNSVTVREDACEAWHKLESYLNDNTCRPAA